MGKLKKPLVRSKHRWQDNIKMDLEEMGRGIEWVGLAQDRDMWRGLVIAVMNLWVT